MNFYVLAEKMMVAKIAKLLIYSLFQTAKYLWGNSQLFLCRLSYLTIYVCSPNHYADLKVQLHELAIFIMHPVIKDEESCRS